MKIRLVVTVLFAMLLTSAGCAPDPQDDQYHFGYRYTTYFPDEVPKMIEACQLTPADTLMIDLTGAEFLNAAAGQTCKFIRAELSTFKEAFGYDPMSLLYNPALTSGPPSLQGMQYALIWIDCPPGNNDKPCKFGEVFVDLVHNKFGPNPRYGGLVLNYNPFKPSLPDLPAEAKASFLASLEPMLNWGDDWVEVEPGLLNAYSWTIAVATADSRIYRWGGFLADRNNEPVASLVPPDFLDVYNAFWDILR